MLKLYNVLYMSEGSIVLVSLESIGSPLSYANKNTGKNAIGLILRRPITW